MFQLHWYIVGFIDKILNIYLYKIYNFYMSCVLLLWFLMLFPKTVPFIKHGRSDLIFYRNPTGLRTCYVRSKKRLRWNEIKLLFHFDIAKCTNRFEVQLLVPSCTPGTIRNLYTKYVRGFRKCTTTVNFPVVYLKFIQNKIQSSAVQDDIRLSTVFQSKRSSLCGKKRRGRVVTIEPLQLWSPTQN